MLKKNYQETMKEYYAMMARVNAECEAERQIRENTPQPTEFTKAQEDKIFKAAFHEHFEDGSNIEYVAQIVNRQLGTQYTGKTIENILEKLAEGRKKKELKSWFGA
jgi:hypothetical protein